MKIFGVVDICCFHSARPTLLLLVQPTNRSQCGTARGLLHLCTAHINKKKKKGLEHLITNIQTQNHEDSRRQTAIFSGHLLEARMRREKSTDALRKHERSIAAAFGRVATDRMHAHFLFAEPRCAPKAHSKAKTQTGVEVSVKTNPKTSRCLLSLLHRSAIEPDNC